MLHNLPALDSVQKVEIIPYLRVLFRILVPSVFPVIIRIDTRRPTDSIVEHVCQVAGFLCTVVAVGSGSHLKPFQRLGRKLGTVGKFLEPTVHHHSRIVHIAERHTIAYVVFASGHGEIVLLIDRGICLVEGRHSINVRVCDVIRIARLRNAVRILFLVPP